MLDQEKEAVRFDPSGNYVRRWLPVLSRLPNKWIHRCACASNVATHVLSAMPFCCLDVMRRWRVRWLCCWWPRLGRDT